MAQFELYSPHKGAVALVTGAGSGIGQCYALRLAAMGYDMVLVGLDEGALRSTKMQIEELFPDVKIFVKEIDLAETDSAEMLFDWCEISAIKPSVVINNAGVFAFSDVSKIEPSRLERLLILHCLTLTKICRLFSIQMSQSGGGYILNMSSYSQWMPFPGLSLYGASKSYVKNFSVAFSKEVEDIGVVVTAISPAGVATELYGLPANLQQLGLKLGVLISANSCARRGLQALSRGRRSIIPDWWNMIFIPIIGHLPSLFERWLRKKTIIYQK